jgi:hypothetical protein
MRRRFMFVLNFILTSYLIRLIRVKCRVYGVLTN